MIINGILLVFQGIINVLLSPLSILSVGVDFLSSITVVQQFLQVVAYLFPWSYILPLITFIVSVFVFRIAMSIVKLILDFKQMLLSWAKFHLASIYNPFHIL